MSTVRSAAEFKIQDSGEPFPPAIDIHAPGAYLQILFLSKFEFFQRR
jgi:hypothetical protein